MLSGAGSKRVRRESNRAVGGETALVARRRGVQSCMYDVRERVSTPIGEGNGQAVENVCFAACMAQEEARGVECSEGVVAQVGPYACLDCYPGVRASWPIGHGRRIQNDLHAGGAGAAARQTSWHDRMDSGGHVRQCFGGSTEARILPQTTLQSALWCGGCRIQASHERAALYGGSGSPSRHRCAIQMGYTHFN